MRHLTSNSANCNPLCSPLRLLRKRQRKRWPNSHCSRQMRRSLRRSKQEPLQKPLYQATVEDDTEDGNSMLANKSTLSTEARLCTTPAFRDPAACLSIALLACQHTPPSPPHSAPFLAPPFFSPPNLATLNAWKVGGLRRRMDHTLQQRGRRFS